MIDENDWPALRDRWRLIRWPRSEVRPRSLLGDAVEQLVESGRGSWFQDEIFEAPEWWFAPYGWIGCIGHVVSKHNGYTVVLGSDLDIDKCFWAYERGILVDQPTLVIDRVANADRAIELMTRLDNRSRYNPVPIRGRDEDGRPRWLTRSEIAAGIEALPFRIPARRLWFAIRALHEGVEEGVFEFHIEGPLA